jgi:16S rRNA (adenine1518-N6/adenine1519-N6)-dimethyltransferase
MRFVRSPPHCYTPISMARQRMGQHFLSGPSWQSRILETLPLAPNERWIEIGAGHGEMTRLLAARGQRVTAIEADSRLAAALHTAIDESPPAWSVEIVSANILGVDLSEISGENFRVYGNLPYYITSPILHHLFRHIARIASIHVVIQLEVAERIVARPGHREYGYLSAACQFYTTPQIVFRIPPGAFRPPPKVTSALVRLDPNGARDQIINQIGISEEQHFLDFVQLCFAHKRKTLRNNLLAIASTDEIQHALAAAVLRFDARAEQLSLAQFAALFFAIAAKGKSKNKPRKET